MRKLGKLEKQRTSMNAARNTVGVRELKAHLSAFLRKVKNGTTVTISEHGKPIARIVPEVLPEPELVEQILRTGLICWNKRRLKPRKPVARCKGKKTVAELLLENRECTSISTRVPL